VDLSFDPGSSITQPNDITTVLALADRHLLVAGQFSDMGGAYRGGIARLNADGTADATFQNGLSGVGVGYPYGSSATVKAAVVQPDGKVVIGGDFGLVNGQQVNALARLNADGSLDEVFNPPSLGTVLSLGLQSGGKVIVGIQYAYNSSALARLNTDGSLDTAFAAGISNSYAYNYAGVKHIAIQPDGKILISGDFDRVGSNVVSSGFARLNSDGSFDTSFITTNGYDSSSGFALQTDGKIHFGYFRLNSNGTRDTSYVQHFTGVIHGLAVQSDGRALLGCGSLSFTSPTATRGGIVRVNSNGTLDTSLANVALPLYFDSVVHAIAALPDGKVVFGGQYIYLVDGIQRRDIGRLNADGSLDETFHAGRPALTGNYGYTAGVDSAVAQPDGRVLIGGGFVSVGGTNRNGIARLNSDGTLDTSFQNFMSGVEAYDYYGNRTAGRVASIALQPDGKVVAGGSFNWANGLARTNLARFNPNGSLDTNFLSGLAGADDVIQALALQPDGRIVIAGNFHSLNGAVRNGVGRLNADGTLDTGFQNGMAGLTNTQASQYERQLATLALQPDGRLLVGGSFNSINGAACSGLGRLNVDGSLDQDFSVLWLTNRGYTAPGAVESISLQPDGKILIAGSFDTVNGATRNGLARLNADGTLDRTFQEGQAGAQTYFLDSYYAPDGAFYPAEVTTVAVQPNGQVLVSGLFEMMNGVARKGLARLNPDGTLDTSFLNDLSGLTDGYGNPSAASSIAVLPDERILVAGNFGLVNGTIIPSVARLFGRGSEPVIYLQPENLRPAPGSEATFRITAAGDPALTFQWRKNGVDIPGATDLSLTLPAVQASDEAVYSATVRNALDLAVSSDATLRLEHPPIADASATARLCVSINGMDATVVLDGSRSSDPDQDPLQFAWYAGGSSEPIAGRAVATLALPVGAHPLSLVVDDGLMSATNFLTIQVLTVAQAADWLMSLAASDASRAQPLRATLAAALASIDRSNPASAIGQLHAFENKVQAQVAPVNPELAATFIQAAQTLIDELNGQGTDLRAFAISAFQINLLWSDVSTNEDGYKIERSSDGTNFTQITQVLPNTTSFRNIGLFPDRRYFYRVRAFNASSNAPFGNVASATTPAIACSLSLVRWGDYNSDHYLSEFGNVVSVAMNGNGDFLTLKSDGTVESWMDGTNLSDVIAVALGSGHALALRDDGTVVGRGGNDFGQATAPTNLTGVVAIAAGLYHSLALKNDGTVVGWGGFSSPYYGDYSAAARPPTNLTGVVAIAAGNYHSLALKSDGTVVDWGDESAPTNLTGVVAISGGAGHSLALKSDGTVVSWCCDGVIDQSAPALSNIVAIAAGGSHDVVLNDDGTVFAWGYDYSGLVPPPASLSSVVSIASGGDLNLALTTLPTAPAGLAAKPASPTEVALSWSDNPPGADNIQIERALGDAIYQNERHGLWEQIGSVGGSVTNLDDPNATRGLQYWYRLRAHTSCGDSLYSRPVIVSVVPPNAPQSLTLSLGDTNEVIVYWYPGYGQGGTDGFKVERALDSSGPWTQIALILVTNQVEYNYPYLDTNVTANTTYWYRVRAFNAVGNSPYSYTARISVAPPAAPAYFGVNVGITNPADVVWQDLDSFQAAILGFKLERAPDVSGNPGVWAEIANFQQPSAYPYYYYGYLFYSDTTGVVTNASYWYRLRAYNWVSDSAYSVTASVRIAAPSAPANLTGYSYSSDSVSLSWDANDAPVGYKIERYSNGWTQIGTTLPPYNNSFWDTGLAANTTYLYRVRAFNWVGDSPYSRIFGVRTVTAFAVARVARAASTSLVLSDCAIVSGRFEFSVKGEPGQEVVTEASSDLVNWTALATNRLMSASFRFSDAASVDLLHRFYRARAQ
jgi:uncharacterized delta-60 repeat protein